VGYVYAENTDNKYTNKIAIFYPQAKEPYNSIYQNIIAGTIEAAKKNSKEITIEKFTIEKKFNAEKIASNLEAKHINKVIVLVRSGWKLAKQLSKFTLDDQTKKFQVVSGALPISPNGVSGISLITDSAYLFNYLAQVAPDVKKFMWLTVKKVRGSLN
jgi:putative ABC transport system substrate-binding protein